MITVSENRPIEHESKPPINGIELSETLKGCANSLKDCCNGVESNFIRLGEDLQSIYTDASSLTQQTIDTVQGSSEDSNEIILNKILAATRSTLTAIETDQSQMEENLSLINTIIQHLNPLSKTNSIIERIAKTLRMIGLNIKIESARLEEDSETFTVFGQEIKELSESVRRLVETITEQTNRSQSSLTVFQNNMSKSLKNLRNLSQGAEESVNSAIPEVEKIIKLSVSIFNRTSDKAREISQQIGEIVVGIQIHDSVSQRIEHIVKSLEEANTLCGEPYNGETGAGIDERYSMAYSIINLQSAQLRLLIDEIGSVYQRSKEAFDKLHIIVEDISCSLSTLGSGRLEAGEISLDEYDNPMDSLKSALERIHDLLNQWEERLSRLNSATDQSKESAASLMAYLQQVQDINFAIKLKALNATANSMRLGAKGKAMTVLVQEMKEIADQSNRFVSEVKENITAISQSAQTIKTRTQKDSGEKRQEEIGGQKIDIGLNEFSKASHAFKENHKGIRELSLAIKNKIAIIIAELEFLGNFSNELALQLNKLEDILNILSAWENGSSNSPILEADKIYERYTMQQERNIHKVYLKEGSNTDVASADSDFKNTDDCEIFEAPSELISNNPDRAGKDSDALGDNVELF